MFDTYPHIRYFVDLHSYSEDILYSRKIALELAHTMRDAIKASRG
ncbi:hypothetical protein PTKU46_93890 [Paraburkholderia terrae]